MKKTSKIIAVLAVLIAGSMIVSGATLSYFGRITTTVTANQTVLVDGLQYPASGDITDTILELYPGGETFCFSHWLENKGSVPIEIDFDRSCSATDFDENPINCNGVTTTYYKAPAHLQATGDSTAEWTTDEKYSGKYSAKLSMPNNNWAVSGSNAEIKIYFDPKVSELTSWSYWAKPGPDGSYILPILIYTDLDANGDGKNDVIQCQAMGDLAVGWNEITQNDIDMYMVFDFDENLFKWYGSYSSNGWDEVIAVYGDANVLSFQVGYGGLGSTHAKSVFVDDITISGEPYNLELTPLTTPFILQPGETMYFCICHSFDAMIYPGNYEIVTKIISP